MVDHIFVSGFPGPVGGANTECWHTARLWREHGLSVTFIPTWKATQPQLNHLEKIGCKIIESDPDSLRNVPGLPEGVVVSFCNSSFLKIASRFQDLGCRIVWLGCMTWLFAEERKHYRRRRPFEAYQPQLAKFGVKPSQCHRIRGALCWGEFPFQPLPHKPAAPFVVGRLSRAAEDKYSSNTWSIYGRIPHPVNARLMAWDRNVQRKLGKPPQWAECLPAGAETAQQFFSKLHCMMQANGGAGENWPRSGLEAMASGVPVVVQNRWGWREMIRHGRTGYLCKSDDELAFYTARLAYDEDQRLEMAHQARKTLETELANPDSIWARWQKLFDAIE